jgi:hypothetical protein
MSKALTQKTCKEFANKNNWQFKLKEVTNEEEGRFIEGYASTDDLDRVDDVITLEALKAVAKKIVKNGSNTVLYNHNRNDNLRNSGRQRFTGEDTNF